MPVKLFYIFKLLLPDLRCQQTQLIHDNQKSYPA